MGLYWSSSFRSTTSFENIHFNIILITPTSHKCSINTLWRDPVLLKRTICYPILLLGSCQMQQLCVSFLFVILVTEWRILLCGFRLSAVRGGKTAQRKSLWVMFASGKPVWMLIHPYPTATQTMEFVWRLLVANVTGQQTRNIASAWRPDDDSRKRNWETNLERKNISPVLYWWLPTQLLLIT